MKKAQSNRGYEIDQILAIGHLEAAISHIDEFAIARDDYIELGKRMYSTRKELMRELFAKCKDPNFWCIIKHLSAAYVMACESCHSKGYDSESVMNMNRIGDSLASAVELAFGIEKTACLRCLSETMAEDADE